MNQIDKIVDVASKLPTGLVDPKAAQKMGVETLELKAALKSGDRLAAIMEAGDVCYYAIKSWANGLIDATYRDEIISDIARIVGLSVSTLLSCVIAKMSLRAIPGNPKNDKAER